MLPGIRQHGVLISVRDITSNAEVCGTIAALLKNAPVTSVHDCFRGADRTFQQKMLKRARSFMFAQ